MGDMTRERWEGKSLDELVASLMGAEPGSMVLAQVRAAIDVKIAEVQRDAAKDALTWAKISAVSTAVASAIAVAALLRQSSRRAWSTSNGSPANRASIRATALAASAARSRALTE